MRRFFQKKQIFTLPNLLSTVRIALIPLIVWLYTVEENYLAAVAVILLSGATDIVDGWIARRFNMISDFGKALDPLADKLTQATVLLCLLTEYSYIWVLFILFALCELAKLTLGVIIAQKYDEVNSAKWYGKVNTVIIYATLLSLILFPQMHDALATSLMLFCAAFMVFTHVMYFIFMAKIVIHKRKNPK